MGISNDETGQDKRSPLYRNHVPLSRPLEPLAKDRIITHVSDPRQNSAYTEAVPKRHYILGTAGHIDHGKTTLVKALTGTDTDRLPEERRRGMTIELGFADLTIGDICFGIVDVPGHERFVRTMVAGATGIDIALIVIAADDSVMPQTIEHVAILHLLGVSRAVVAVTKIDTVDSEMVELVIDDVRTLLADTALAQAAICPLSSVSGDGLAALKDAIVSAAKNVERTTARQPFRMAVDRVFTIQGRGTVVTGSVLRGEVSEGDTLDIWPRGDSCRVRGLQTHGAQLGAVARGQRAAINISGVDRDRIQRGCELATPSYLKPARMLDVRLDYLSSNDRPLKSTSVVRLEVSTSEIPARVVLLNERSLEPGASAFAQLRCGEPVTTVFRQRFIIRDENAVRTLGGGIVLRPDATRRRGDPGMEADRLERLLQGDDADRVEEVLRRARFTRPTDLELCARAGVEIEEMPEVVQRLKNEKRYGPVAGTETFAVPSACDDLAARLTAWLERHHRNHPELPGRLADSVLGWLERLTMRSLARPLMDRFIKSGEIKRLGRFICAAAFAPKLAPADEKLLGALIEEIRKAKFQPPSVANAMATAPLDKKRRERLATLAVAMGELIQIDTKILLHADAERQLRKEVAEEIHREGGVSVARIRELLDSSRKFVVPFVEYLDRVGFTKRVGDQRVLAEPIDP